MENMKISQVDLLQVVQRNRNQDKEMKNNYFSLRLDCFRIRSQL